MQCFVYKSTSKDGAYLYLAAEDDFDCLPQALRHQLGRLELALQFELSAERRLNRENPAQVLANLRQRGYHLQMPETVESLLARHRSAQTGGDGAAGSGD